MKRILITLLLTTLSCSQISLEVNLQRSLMEGKWDSAIQLLQSVPKTDQNYYRAQIKLKELQTGLKLFKQNNYWVCPLQNGTNEVFDRDYHNNKHVRIEGNTIYNRRTGAPLMRFTGYIDNRSIEIMDVGYMEFITGGGISHNGRKYNCHIEKAPF